MTIDPRVGLSTGTYTYGSEVDAALDSTFLALDMDPQDPFGQWVGPGATVTLKPNWVLHANPLGYDLDSLVTHPDLLFAIAERVATALGHEGHIVIGDAPLQGCDFNALMAALQIEERAERFRAAHPGIELSIEDWRLTVLEKGDAGNGPTQHFRDKEDVPDGYELVDRGTSSFLEPISDKSELFRVTCYKPSLMAAHHRPGRHEYLVVKRVLDSDLVINVPKFKTHIKAGLTGSLKNLVGINGHKEFLPHHILGPAEKGGDCYRDASRYRSVHDRLYDYTWEHLMEFGPRRRAFLTKVVSVMGVTGRMKGDGIDAGSWSGNDTIWRTTLDLNHVLYQTGTAKVFHIVDGIMAGQGEGPLTPEPMSAGLLLAGANPAHIDAVMAQFMGYRVELIPTVFKALTDENSCFAGTAANDIPVGRRSRSTVEELSLQDLKPLGFKVPLHWQDASRDSGGLAPPGEVLIGG